MNFDFVNFRCGPEAQHFPRIMRGKITAAIVLESGALLSPCGPRDFRADSITITVHALQSQPNPVIPLGSTVLEQERSGAVIAYQHIEGAIVIEVSHRQTARRKAGPACALTSCSL